MNEYLGFVDFIGRANDGGYIYRFDFTTDSEILWGEYFNVTPSAIIPDLQPDKNTLTKTCKIIFPREMIIAKNSYCFSMQDCIDGIMPLIFSEIDENTLVYNDSPFFLHFGETFENINKIITEIGLNFFDIEDVQRGDDSAIDELMNIIDESASDVDDYDDENF